MLDGSELHAKRILSETFIDSGSNIVFGITDNHSALLLRHTVQLVAQRPCLSTGATESGYAKPYRTYQGHYFLMSVLVLDLQLIDAKANRLSGKPLNNAFLFRSHFQPEWLTANARRIVSRVLA
jgi:hypothetical protein